MSGISDESRRYSVYDGGVGARLALGPYDLSLPERDGLALTLVRPDPKPPIPSDELMALACSIYDTRRQRSRFFANSLLGEPVWDMLLALYCQPLNNAPLSVSGLCCASAVPHTTGLRWLQVMEQQDLVERYPDANDGRRFWLRLTGKGEELMTQYLRAVHRMLLQLQPAGTSASAAA